MASESVDLIYLDPPFNSQRSYNLIYRQLTGRPVPEQAIAFCDAWELDRNEMQSLPTTLLENGVNPEMVNFLQACFNSLKDNRPELVAYLMYMAYRLLEMKRLLRREGSIYLHCDPTASHYIKIIMDGIFGHRNFRNEIIWRRTNAHNKLSKQYGPIHDVILFYTGSDKFHFTPGTTPYTKAYIEDRFTHHDERGIHQKNYLTGPGKRNGESGKEWRGFNPTDNGRHWAIPKSLREFLRNNGNGMSQIECLESLYEQGLIVFPKKTGGQPMYKQYVGIRPQRAC